jgi:hypothetical protein
MRKRTKITFCRSQERERDLHELGLARWWAKDHKQMKLQLEGARRDRCTHPQWPDAGVKPKRSGEEAVKADMWAHVG